MRLIPKEPGENVFTVIRRALGDTAWHTPCGGRGICGKCRLKLTGMLSLPGEREIQLLGLEAIRKGWRLACLTCAWGEFYCENLPEEGDKAMAVSLWNDRSVDAAGGVREYGKYGGMRTETDPWKLAADIGTTTVALYLCGPAGEVYAAGLANPQRCQGADVMTRLTYCMERGRRGTAELQAMLFDAMAHTLTDLCRHAGISVTQITEGILVGNTVLEHLCGGFNPCGIGQAPYQPTSCFGFSFSAEQIGFPLHAGRPIFFAPCVSGFVGGDVVAGLREALDRWNREPLAKSAVDMEDAEATEDTEGAAGEEKLFAGETVLYLDLGTNGEMVLIRGDVILACATAAGPALEGASIACGCPGIPGAVFDVREGPDGRLLPQTIGGGTPCGICGSGLIAYAAALYRRGKLNETGRLCESQGTGKERLVWVNEAAGIYLCEADFSALCLAKAAIAAGICRLCAHAGCKVGSLTQIILAGGFGSSLDPDDLRTLGILPPDIPVYAIGNAAGQGAVHALQRRSGGMRLQTLANRIRYIELADDPLFSETFTDCLPLGEVNGMGE